MATKLKDFHIMSRISRRKRGPVQAKKTIVDNIEFKSGLEAYMYKALKNAKIKAEYEGTTFELVPSFVSTNNSYERTGNGKGEFKNRGNKKILNLKYTPDFIGANFVIECKGRANESFPIRWKLFKKYMAKHYPKTTFYKPQNQKECDKTIELILGSLKK